MAWGRWDSGSPLHKGGRGESEKEEDKNGHLQEFSPIVPPPLFPRGPKKSSIFLVVGVRTGATTLTDA